MENVDVAIVGAGIAGLACGVALSDAGFRVLVLEAADTPGGRARSWTDATTGDRVDIGPHILLSEYRNMLAWLERLGTASQVRWQRERFLTLVDPPHAPVAVRVGRLPPPLHMLPSMLAIPQLSLRDTLSNARLMWRIARLTPQALQALDGTTAEALLRADGVSPRYVDWFWRTAAMTVMNVPLNACSAAALLQLFRYLMGVGSYRVGFARVGLGDLYVPQAVRAIEAAGGRVRTSTQAASLRIDGDRATGLRLHDGTEIRARACVAAVPPAELADLLPPGCEASHPPFARLRDFAPSPYVSTYLWFDRVLGPARFWSNVWAPDRLNYDFYDLAHIRDDLVDRRSVIAANIIYSDRLPPLDDAAIIEATRRELCLHVPEAAHARLVHAAVHRIPMAIPAPFPGSEAMRPVAVTPIDGLVLAGDWLQTGLPVSMESAARAAALAAEAVCTSLGRPRTIVKPLPRVEGLFALAGRGRMP
ncbi:hydroxysqualene dehydroxylase HpnE [Cognatilysobacter segetis]|uniref:hydroxysqualene dehydroxylase HpnE n=1 Tax=Cognatilysobacter segetis TaxID=2492394 RepID=UPI001061664F|nr:hydroxysqualene dehydroxylase HpnE [Lysobacter segetis]